jgi:hypothetical protein
MFLDLEVMVNMKDFVFVMTLGKRLIMMMDLVLQLLIKQTVAV